MNESRAHLESKLATAACLLILGLLVEGITLFWAHPTSFLLFLIVGGILVAAGVAVYLFAVVAH